jgi:NADPH:quinone reductase-like Zn-dependent oxidoreductase
VFRKEATMKAIELQAFGLDGLRIVDTHDAAPPPGHVTLRLHAASLNYRDLEILEGRYGMPVPLPCVPLSDAVGTVARVGPGVTAWQEGDRVNPLFFPDWLDGPFHPRYFAHQLGAGHPGVLRQTMTLPATAVVRAPRHLGIEAATLPIAALTAWSALTDAALLPGQTILTIGSGGVALFALQFAAMFGVRAIAVTSSAHKVPRLLAAGAAAAVDSRAHPDWGAEVLRLTDGAGVQLVLETGGSATFAGSVRALAPGGTMAMVGYLSGPRLEMDMRDVFIAKRARLHGHTVGNARQFDAMNRALEAGGIVPLIDSIHPFGDAAAAYRRLASGESVGKILISLD